MPRAHHTKAPFGSLVSSVNTLAVPPGALIEARNVEFTEAGAIKPRRGFGFVDGWEPGDVPASMGSIKQGMDYKGTFFVIDDDGDIVWNSGTGALDITTETISDDHANGYGWHRYAYMNGNIYYTTDKGLRKIDAVNGSPIAAGLKDIPIPAALRYIGATGYPRDSSTAGNEFLANGSSVGYQCVIGYRDENNNVILGVPSGKALYTNSSGSAGAVDIAYLFDGVTTDHFIQLYRTPASTTTTVGENYGLVAERQFTATDISNGYVLFTDFVPDALLGIPLYSGANAEGVLYTNFPPPVCSDIAPFAGYLFGALRTPTHSVALSLGSVAVVAGDAGLRAASAGGGGTADWTSGSPTVTSLSSTTGVEVGMYLADSVSGFSQGARVIAVTANSVTFDVNATATVSNFFGTLRFGDAVHITDGASIDEVFYASDTDSSVASLNTFYISKTGTASEVIRKATERLVSTINRVFVSNGGSVYARSLSEVSPGYFTVVNQNTNYSTPTFEIFSSNPTAFFPELPVIGSSEGYAVIEDLRQNGLVHSKFQQPEAFPLPNIYYIGEANYPILRLATLQNSLIILKQDGIYQLTGYDENSFRVRCLDPSIQLTHINSVAVVHNRAYALTDRGVVSVGENDVRTESQSIHNLLYNQTSGFVPPSDQHLVNAIGVEDTSEYILQLADADNTVWCYNVVTGQWCNWSLSSKDYLAISWSDVSGNVYVCDWDSQYVSQRLTGNTSDETYTIGAGTYTVDLVNQTLTIPNTQLAFRPRVGDRVSKTFITTYVRTSEVSGSNWIITLQDPFTSVQINPSSPPALTFKVAIESFLTWAPAVAENMAAVKHWDRATLHYKSNTVDSHYLYWSTDKDGQADIFSSTSPYDISTMPSYKSLVSRTPTGADAVDVYSVGVPIGARYTTRLKVAFHHRRGGQTFTLEALDLEYKGNISRNNRKSI